MKSPLVSIILVTHNSDEYLNQCLKSIFSITYSNFEVIIFDNNSADDTKKIVEKFSNSFSKNIISVLNKDNLGYARANNLAVELSNGEFIFIINPDTHVDKGFLEPLVSEIQKKNVSAVQPLVYLFDKKTINLSGKVTHFLGFDWLKDFNQTIVPIAQQIFSFSGSGILINKRDFLSINGFDEQFFMYYEDSDLSWKLNLIGKKILFTPKSVLYHDYKYIPQEKYQPLKRKLFFIERNRLQTIFKNYSFKTLLLLSPAIIFMEIGMVTFAIIDGWGFTKLKTYLSIMQNFSTLNSNRKFIQKKRSISDNIIIQNFKSRITFEKFSNPIIRYFVNPVLDLYIRIIKVWL
jgi:GT2 family glycosyltransferase